MKPRRSATPLFGEPEPDQNADPIDDRVDLRAVGVQPASFSDELQRLGRRLPASVHLGTSSWSFPGWDGLVYGGAYPEAKLAREGLAAYAQHPVLRTVSIDRGFYQPLSTADFARYARQVPAAFRFVVKAPASVTDAVVRGEGGLPAGKNPNFLDVAAAFDSFVAPATAGLGAHCGPLVFQLSPMPREFTHGEAAAATIARLGEFLSRLPPSIDTPEGGRAPIYAVELRNPELFTPRLVRTLREAGARLCLSLHARMPDAPRQATALRTMDADDRAGQDEPPGQRHDHDWLLRGPLIVRWNLHPGAQYEAARARYAPFDRLIDADILTRGTLAHLIHVAIRSGQPAYLIANNKAEGSAPLSCVELARAVVAGA